MNRFPIHVIQRHSAHQFGQQHSSIAIFIKLKELFLFLMDEIYYQRFLEKFPEQAYALCNWKPQIAAFHNGLEADLIARKFVDYLASLPPETRLSYFGHTVKAVPFHIVVKSIAADDSLDYLLQEVEHQRGNGNPHFLYVLADPLQILDYEDRKINEIYGINIAACISLWDGIEKRNSPKNEKRGGYK